jgi:hypothetical protein
MAHVFGMVTTARSHAYTRHALASFFGCTHLGGGDRLFVIDNDGDYEATLEHAARTIVRNAHPQSFARNVNAVLGLAREAGADLVFLNNDIVFTRDWLPPLTVTDDAILIPASNQLFGYMSSDRRLALEASMDWDDFGGQHDLLERLAAYHSAKFRASPLGEGLRMPFFCFRLPARIYTRVGGFDERFGTAGGEDVDYRIRCLASGFDVRYALQSYLLHFHGKSTWRGGEHRAEGERRDRQYRDAFRGKWGADLTAVFLADTGYEERLAERALGGAFARGDYRQIVVALLPRE